MKTWLGWLIAGAGAAALSAAAQASSKLAVGPDAGGYLCPDGRQLYVKSCYNDSPYANCGVVLMHVPPQRGYQQERTQTRAEITGSVAACKVYPLNFHNDGTVVLVLPKAPPPQQTAKAPAVTPAPKTGAKANAPAARPAALAPRALAKKRLPETELEKKFFKGMQDNLFPAAMNAVIRARADNPVPVAELVDKQGMTALHWAVESRNEAAIRWLLDKKSNVDLADEKGRTPLKIALDNKDTRAMAILLDRGANAGFALPGHDAELKGFKKSSELAEFMIKAAATPP